MKKLAKSLIVYLLGKQVKRLVKKHNLKVIAVAGSVGKTSTKLATAAYLRQNFRVQTQEGNYNDILTVPLVFFGHTNPPSLTNPFAWIKILVLNEQQIKSDYPYDLVVVELGTDGPRQLIQFKKYLYPEIAVITAISPEHMEFFKTLDAVATEELSLATFSKTVLINTDLCKPYSDNLTNTRTYGLQSGDIHFTELSHKQQEYNFTIQVTNETIANGTYKAASETQLYGVLAAVAVGEQLGFPREKVSSAVQQIVPSPGRMRALAGVNNTTILDDTYNSSPDAAKAALTSLYNFEAPQRIALLGNMNELGDYSEQAHREIGKFCDGGKLDLVVTLGKDANAFTAVAARENGCRVETVDSPYKAAEIIKQNMQQGAVILAKGSQNGVFAEEAVKQLLADPSDSNQLVRQSPGWLKKKEQQFGVPK